MSHRWAILMPIRNYVYRNFMLNSNLVIQPICHTWPCHTLCFAQELFLSLRIAISIIFKLTLSTLPTLVYSKSNRNSNRFFPFVSILQDELIICCDLSPTRRRMMLVRSKSCHLRLRLRLRCRCATWPCSSGNIVGRNSRLQQPAALATRCDGGA